MVREINAADWEEHVTRSKEPVVVDFWHEQCMWCKRLEPVYEDVSNQLTEFKFTKLNIRSSHENMHVSLNHGIMGTPTLKVFCDGREVGEIIGYMEKEALRAGLERILEDSKRCLTQTTVVEPKE